MKSEFIINPKLVVNPERVLENQSVTIKNDRISKIENGNKHIKNNFSLDQFFIYPSMINAHDHLLGSYFPRVGDRKPYLNWKPWDDDLKSSPIYQERGKNENIDLYYLGCYRHLISGVLTVSDHIPHKVNEPFIPKMPIRIIEKYSLAHEVSSYDLKWGEGVDIEYKKAVNNNEPFITHIEEGFDDEAMRGIDYLIEMSALGEHTVLVHGIALSDEDIKNIALHNANVVWCPFSNFYMFERTARIKEIVSANINTSLGTDSPMSGSINILEELKFAKRIYYEMYSEKLSDQLLLQMVTINPAKALRVDKDLGSLEEGKKADFIALRDKGKDPYGLLIETELEDIALVFYDGKPIYGDEEFSNLFKHFGLTYSKFQLNKSNKIITGENPLNLLRKIQKAVGYKKEIPFLPIN
ncbi:MAG: amidohydrolase family protein [Spirochaetota bacterium]|nr:amidohydrolase family protein [Spirochaetota bacterium]